MLIAKNELEKVKYGIWVDHLFTWVGGLGWSCERENNQTTKIYRNKSLHLVLIISTVERESLISQKITVINTLAKKRELKIFLSQDLVEEQIESVSFYAPTIQALIRSYNDQYMLLSGFMNNKGIVQYCTDFEETSLIHEGFVSLEPFSINSLKSIFSLETMLESNDSIDADFWICFGLNEDDVLDKHTMILDQLSSLAQQNEKVLI